MDEEFNEAEIGFRKAEDANNDSYIAKYNTTAALYQQNNMEESGKRFAELMAEAPDDAEQAKLLHNLGNVLLNGQKYKEAAETYKKSLRINPEDEDTRYNLTYALEKLREQQQQQQNQDQQNNDQNQDKEKNDQEQENQQNKDQEQEKEQEQKQNEDQEQQQQRQKQELNKEEAERLLNAILQKEKEVKEKVDKKKATAAKIKTEKDW
jgi:tetratricopeptide (TPR) repeat protein